MGIFAQDNAAVAAGPYQRTGLGYVQFSLTTVQTLAAAFLGAGVPYTLSGQEREALISVEGNGVRWTDDGQTPTTSYGNPIGAGQDAILARDFSKIQLVAQNATATVNVTFSR